MSFRFGSLTGPVKNVREPGPASREDLGRLQLRHRLGRLELGHRFGRHRLCNLYNLGRPELGHRLCLCLCLFMYVGRHVRVHETVA